jgi:uncharacterized membrane protein
VLAVTRSDVLVTLHIVAVVAAFGGALAYPLWFRMIRDATPEQRAFFHRAQARLGKFLITPSILVVFATGAYLASDLGVWSEGWVLIPTAMLALILLLGGVVLGPSEEQLSRYAGPGSRREYDLVFRRVRLITWLLALLVVVATFLMVARIPRSSGGAGTSRVGPPVRQAGCLSCHSVGSEGRARPGGDLSTIGTRFTRIEIRQLLLNPPAGMPSFDTLSADQLDSLVSSLSQLR